ncbi:NERD domain-containing protein [Vibrio vulnificus]|nr:NERD domain-containing protein [Vibrio vulnificus]EKO5192244.1 NERD domain-containing protein [Vibrio vulnificus]HAS6217501.1 NERD domain-containing protein [Vibrio vulnificus]
MFNTIRGWFGEKKTTLNMWASLNSRTYHRFHDIYVPTFNGTAQIDHLLISPFGVFIVETKNLKGWIFGDEYASQWTQSLYGNKYRFQNPLRQTYRQKKALAAYFDIDERIIETVVYFVGDCDLKTEMPYNVLDRGLGRYIKGFTEVVLSAHEIDELVKRISYNQNNCTVTKREHVQALRTRHNSKTTCPKCGSPLVERTARQGSYTGSSFLGCSGFPKCRFITK